MLIFDTETCKLYHARLMTALPASGAMIDSLDFARKALEIHDTIAVSQFLRLADFLSTPDGTLEYQLTGYLDEHRRPGLKLHITGRLMLVCQRCLGALEFDLDKEAVFALVRDEAEIPDGEDENDEIDYLVAEAQMSVSALIEDELLLSLPLAPKHDSTVCGTTSKLSESKKASPFAELEKLKSQGR